MHLSADILSDHFPAYSVNLSKLVETLLTETAASFSHLLDLQYDRIGSASTEKHGVPLTKQAVSRMQNLRRAIVLCAQTDTLDLLMDADDAFMESVRSDTLSDLLEEEPAFSCVDIIRSIDEETIRACKNLISKERRGTEFLRVSPSGKSDVWNKVFSEGKDAPSFRDLSASDAIAVLIRNEHFGTILLPPYAGSIFASASLATHDFGLTRSVSFGRSYLFIPDLSNFASDETAAVISVILSTADYLDVVYGLQQEAFCIRTGLHAALEGKTEHRSKWDSSLEPTKIADLVIQQIRFAGQLAHR